MFRDSMQDSLNTNFASFHHKTGDILKYKADKRNDLVKETEQESVGVK